MKDLRQFLKGMELETEQIDTIMAEVGKNFSTLKEERDRAVSELRRGFGFSEEETNKVNSWKRAHSNNRHGARTNADRALRGNYSYEMTPTSVGTIKSCICETCRIKAIEKSNGDINKYRKLLEIYDAVFDISDYDNF